MPLTFETSKPINFRRPTTGPELSLVQQYVETGLPSPEPGECLTVFLEPQLESSFPDMVAVYWNHHKVESVRRATCPRKLEMRIAHWLSLSGEDTESAVVKRFGGHARKAVRHLLEANIIEDFGHRIATRPPSELFAVSRIIAVEAKMSDWQCGLNQALQNTWFASESYLLLEKSASTCVHQAATKLGIGVVAADVPIDYAESVSRREALPHSYGAWLVNEWIWSLSNAIGTGADDDRPRVGTEELSLNQWDCLV